jgi:hypothetical protein
VRAWLYAFLCVACSKGAVGDEPSAPNTNAYGEGARIHELVGEATWLDPQDTESAGCAEVPADRAVDVSGIAVIAVDRFDETGGGQLGNVYVQDVLPDPLPFSGITVFDPGFSPPSLRIVEGDVTDLLGSLTEFLGPTVGRFGFCQSLPELSGAMSLRFEAAEVEPLVIDGSDLESYETARQWMGMLVTVEHVTLAEDPCEDNPDPLPCCDHPSGRCQAPIGTGMDAPTLTNELWDLRSALEERRTELDAGSEIGTVTGIVTYFYGVHLAPRSAADIAP